eukprot:Sspe_Gene.74655::Locus_46643_Transcript_1_1_Confidence_1.000_Length_1288::g.74655::m.74655/K03104/SRP14; signal recognition particle subunit SRP14
MSAKKGPRRPMLDEGQFIKELDKMFSQSKGDPSSVWVTMGKVKNTKAVEKQAKGGKGESPKLVVRGKRKGATISCLVKDVTKFQVGLGKLHLASKKNHTFTCTQCEVGY